MDVVYGWIYKRLAVRAFRAKIHAFAVIGYEFDDALGDFLTVRCQQHKSDVDAWSTRELLAALADFTHLLDAGEVLPDARVTGQNRRPG